MANKHELATKKMQEMRLKNEEILKRFQEVEQDKQKYRQQQQDRGPHYGYYDKSSNYKNNANTSRSYYHNSSSKFNQNINNNNNNNPKRKSDYPFNQFAPQQQQQQQQQHHQQSNYYKEKINYQINRNNYNNDHQPHDLNPFPEFGWNQNMLPSTHNNNNNNNNKSELVNNTASDIYIIPQKKFIYNNSDNNVFNNKIDIRRKTTKGGGTSRSYRQKSENYNRLNQQQQQNQKYRPQSSNIVNNNNNSNNSFLNKFQPIQDQCLNNNNNKNIFTFRADLTNGSNIVTNNDYSRSIEQKNLKPAVKFDSTQQQKDDLNKKSFDSNRKTQQRPKSAYYDQNDNINNNNNNNSIFPTFQTLPQKNVNNSLEDYDLNLIANNSFSQKNYSQKPINYQNNNINTSANDDLFEAYRLDQVQTFNTKSTKTKSKSQQQPQIPPALNRFKGNTHNKKAGFDFSATQEFWEDDLVQHSNLIGNNINDYVEYNYENDGDELNNYLLNSNDESHQIIKNTSTDSIDKNTLNESSTASLTNNDVNSSNSTLNDSNSDPNPIKVLDWAAEMDRIGEQARLVLEQTEKEEDIDGNLLTTKKLENKPTTNIDIEIDDEQDEDDLEAYKVKVEPNTIIDDDLTNNANDLLNKLNINEEIKDENETKTPNEAIN